MNRQRLSIYQGFRGRVNNISWADADGKARTVAFMSNLESPPSDDWMPCFVWWDVGERVEESLAGRRPGETTRRQVKKYVLEVLGEIYTFVPPLESDPTEYLYKYGIAIFQGLRGSDDGTLGGICELTEKETTALYRPPRQGVVGIGIRFEIRYVDNNG